MGKIQNYFRVVENKKLSPRFYRLKIEAPSIRKKIKPGQFLHLRVTDGLEPFFRRPFSVYRAKKHVELFYEPVGPGTEIMARWKKGDAVDCLGPVGTPFDMPPEGTEQVVMIAGGIGIAPFLILSDAIKAAGADGRSSVPEMMLLYGGRTKGHVYPMKEFKDNGVKVHVATDDGSRGTKGKVSKLFSRIRKDPEKIFLYTCGPNPMMEAVQAFARKHRLKGQAACEEIMACALGACLGCSINTKSGYKTVCYEGPCFDLDEIIFE